MSMPQLTPEQLANMPLAPNPLGLPPNYVNPETNSGPAIAVVSVFLAITTIAVALRMVCRVVVVKRTGLDDWCSVLALLSNIAITGCFFYLLDQRILGVHSWNVKLSLFLSKRGTGPLLSIQIVGNLANYFAKMSILLFLRRLFPHTVSPKTAMAIWFGIFANTVAYLILTVYLIAVCVPQVGSPKPGPNMCPGPLQIRLGQGSGAVNAVLDLYAFAVAVPSLWMLQMPMKRKLSVVGVLAVGLCACGFSFATLAKRLNSSADNDPAWNQVSQLVFGIIEALLATTTACLPAMPALWKEVTNIESLRWILSKVSSSSSIWSSSRSKTESKHQTSDDHSMKSLNSHGIRPSYDVEQANAQFPAIQVKNDFTVTSTQK